MSHNSDNKRIAKNTLILYIRMFVLMAVNLYTARIVLASLGIEDYGVYNAVAGFISMFSMVSASVVSSISRYLTYTIGEGYLDKLVKIFSTSIIILLFFSILVLLLTETFGLWFLNNKMTIPAERYFAANWVFQMSLMIFVINLLSVPYNSLLVAREKMNVFAYISIIEGAINLGIAFLIKFNACDRLILYSSLLCIASITIRFIYRYYCKRHFQESRFKFVFEKSLIKEMLGFAGWNFIGTTAGLLRTQGINMLFNVYIGPVINAAYGLSMQVFNAVNKFSSNFYMAVQPQITKSFAANESVRSFDLVCRSSRLAYYLLLLIILPLVLYTKPLLSIWLTEIPNHTIPFTRIAMIFCLSESFSQPLIFLMLANGVIRNYQIVVGGICLLNFPVAWILLHFGISPYYVFFSIVIFSVICMVVRLLMLRYLVSFPVKTFLKHTLLNSIIVTILAFIIPQFIIGEPISFTGLFVNILITELFTIAIIYLIGLDSSERRFIKSNIFKR